MRYVAIVIACTAMAGVAQGAENIDPVTKAAMIAEARSLLRAAMESAAAGDCPDVLVKIRKSGAVMRPSPSVPVDSPLMRELKETQNAHNRCLAMTRSQTATRARQTVEDSSNPVPRESPAREDVDRQQADANVSSVVQGAREAAAQGQCLTVQAKLQEVSRTQNTSGRSREVMAVQRLAIECMSIQGHFYGVNIQAVGGSAPTRSSIAPPVVEFDVFRMIPGCHTPRGPCLGNRSIHRMLVHPTGPNFTFETIPPVVSGRGSIDSRGKGRYTWETKDGKTGTAEFTSDPTRGWRGVVQGSGVNYSFDARRDYRELQAAKDDLEQDAMSKATIAAVGALPTTSLSPESAQAHQADKAGNFVEAMALFKKLSVDADNFAARLAQTASTGRVLTMKEYSTAYAYQLPVHEARSTVALYYEESRAGIPQNFKEAAAWYQKAWDGAKHVNEKMSDGAQYGWQSALALGYFYANGVGVPKDRVRARQLFTEIGAAIVRDALDHNILPKRRQDWSVEVQNAALRKNMEMAQNNPRQNPQSSEASGMSESTCRTLMGDPKGAILGGLASNNAAADAWCSR